MVACCACQDGHQRATFRLRRDFGAVRRGGSDCAAVRENPGNDWGFDVRYCLCE